jgi:release factor glutamine methyltransferase
LALSLPGVTVLEVIQRSSEFLARKGVESPRLQIELLLAHVLQVPRLKLYLNFERRLTDPELEVLRGLVTRRGGREPLQHILGSVSFCGLELEVNREVLIPRPETELLAERACEQAARPGSEAPIILDFGTGSGCLAIALAVRCPAAQVHALEISEAALAVARRNAQRHQVAGRLQFHVGSDLASLPAGLQFDLLVSNPPYIASGEIASLQPEVRDHDPRSALDGGPDGLKFFRLLATEGAARMASGGCALLEFGDGQGEAVRDLFAQQGWRIEAIEKDYSGRARILIARRP